LGPVYRRQTDGFFARCCLNEGNSFGCATAAKNSTDLRRNTLLAPGHQSSSDSPQQRRFLHAQKHRDSSKRRKPMRYIVTPRSGCCHNNTSTFVSHLGCSCTALFWNFVGVAHATLGSTKMPQVSPSEHNAGVDATQIDTQHIYAGATGNQIRGGRPSAECSSHKPTLKRASTNIFSTGGFDTWFIQYLR